MLENGELIISQCGQLFALLLVLWNFSTAIVVSLICTMCLFKCMQLYLNHWDTLEQLRSRDTMNS